MRLFGRGANMTRLLSRRAKDVVPKRRADPVSGVIVSVMMAKMILLQPQPYAAFHWEMMRRVVEHIVAHVAEDEPGKDGRRQTRKNYKEESVKKEGERHADARRHHEPARVAWIIVMNAVDDVVQPFPNSRLRFVMKDVSVNEVLEQRPQ